MGRTRRGAHENRCRRCRQRARTCRLDPDVHGPAPPPRCPNLRCSYCRKRASRVRSSTRRPVVAAGRPVSSMPLERGWAAGGAILPLDPQAPEDVVRRLLAEMRPDAVIDDLGEHPLPDGEEVGDGVAVVIATSGSTGVPKGAELTWAALDASAEATPPAVGQRRLRTAGCRACRGSTSVVCRSGCARGRRRCRSRFSRGSTCPQ